MTESTTEDSALVIERYVRRVEALYVSVRSWCANHDLTVKEGSITIKEMDLPDYDAPTLEISKGSKVLVKLVPIAVQIIRAEGRVDMNGPLARQPLIFRVPTARPYPKEGIRWPKDPNQCGLPRSTASHDGWYWTESLIRRQKPIDESLFLDLITDISDYEF
jgi:hypothetical protein